MKYIKLPKINGQKIRQRYYTPESVKHPAKADISMMIWILKKFVSDGDIVLDPMAGIFTTGIEGMRLFPNSVFIGVELEDKFVKMAQNNIKKVEKIAKNDMFMKVGKAVCIQGDARELEKILREKIDKIISSPPYSEIRMDGGGKDRAGMRPYTDEPADTWRTQRDQRNIGNLKHGKIDKIITSPPYAENPGTPSIGSVSKDNWGKEGKDIVTRRGLERGYSKNPQNIGNLPYADKIITSPPYGKAQSGRGIAKKGYTGSKAVDHGIGSQSYMPENTGNNPDNIDKLGYGSVDKIVSSPPWGGKVQHKTNYLGKQKKESGLEYSENPENIGNLPQGQIDKIITSPPYSGVMDSKRHTDSGICGRDPKMVKMRYVDKIISSPPYSETLDPTRKNRTGPAGTSQPGAWQKGQKQKSSSLPHYGDNPNNIGSLKHGHIDKIISSPPYTHESTASNPTKFEKEGKFKMGHSREVNYTDEDYRTWDKHHGENIGKRKLFIKIPCTPEEAQFHDKRKERKGTIWEYTKEVKATPEIIDKIQKLKNENKGKSETYLEAMFFVYQQCYRVLKPEGLMILITKDFIRNKKRVRLGEDTIKLCEMVGFKHITTYHRKIEHPSFWRRLYRQKYPEAEQVESEDITVYAKSPLLEG